MKKTITRLALAALTFGAINPAAQAASVAPAVAVEATSTTSSEVVLKNAVKDSWTSLSRSERKNRINAAQDALKNLKDGSTNTLLLVILAILLPPLAVFLHEGVFNTRVLLSIILWLLFYIPGLIYALIVILGK